MIKLPLNIPPSVYDALQRAAWAKGREVEHLILELITQKYPPVPSEPMWVQCKQKIEYTACQFATEWALPAQQKR